MKIQLDTEAKTIKLEKDVVMSKLIETLNKLFPNKEWKKFTLETNTTIHHWSNPIYIERYIKPYEPYRYPWYYGDLLNNGNVKLVSKTSNSAMSLKAGTFNIEVE